MKNIIILTLFSCFIFFCGNNIVSLTSPDEVFYVQTAKEMARQGTWVTPYIFGQPQFEKPVLTYDLIRAGFLLFKETPFAARFFPALFALIGILAVYFMAAMAWQDESKAFMAALVLMTSGLYIGLARTVFTDMIFSVFILLSLTSFYAAFSRPAWKTSGLLLFHVFAALAVLTKGPLGFAIPLLIVVIFLLLRKDISFINAAGFWWGLLLFLLLSLPWYIVILRLYDGTFIREFFYNDHWRRLIEAEHLKNDRWYFYPASMALCMFPWVLFVVAACVTAFKAFFKREGPLFQTFLIVWIMVVFVIFQTAHSKLVSYIFPLFPALALLAGECLFERTQRKDAPLSRLFIGTCGLLALIPVAFLVAAVKYPAYLPPKPLFLTGMVVELLFIAVAGVAVYLKNARLSAGIFSLQMPLLVFLLFAVHQNIEPYVSTQDAASWLMNGRTVNGKILTSKFFARAVLFYTGKDVVLMNVNSTNFFSPHPVPDLNTEAKVLDFLKSQPETYGILKKDSWKQLKGICEGHGFLAELLNVIGDEYVVRVAAH